MRFPDSYLTETDITTVLEHYIDLTQIEFIYLTLELEHI